MAYNLDCMADFGKAQTGLTVHGKLQDMSGTLVGSAITSGIVESSVAAGQYLYTLSVADGFSGFFVMYNSADDKLRRTVGISPRETENADVKTSTRGTSTLTTSDIDSRLAAYDAPTKAELDSAVSPLATQTSLDTLAGYVDTEVAAILAAVDTEIAAIKAKTDNLPASPAATTDIPGASAIATAVFAVAVETGHDLTTVLRAVYSQVRGKSRTDAPEAPTYFEYLAPDNTTVRLRHDISEDGTVRSVTVG